MQITLIQQGHCDTEKGHLTREGIRQSIGAGLALGNAAHPKILDFLDNRSGPNGEIQVGKYPLRCPDLILTSSALSAKETGFTVFEQLKHFGLKTKVEYNISCLNDLPADEYRPNHHGYITRKAARKLYQTQQIRETIDLIQKMAEKGKKHIVLVSHQSNIHVLLKLLGNESLYNISGRESYLPYRGSAYTILSVDPKKIGKEKYPIQIRNVYFSPEEAKELSALPPDYIEWYMPNFMRTNSRCVRVCKDKTSRVRE